MKTFPEFRVEDVLTVKDGRVYFDLVLHHSMYCCDVIDASVPVIEKTDKGCKVKVGSIEHPMLDNHYIEFIELIDNGNVRRKFLKPGDKPEVDFSCCSDNAYAREYCNLHGLWKSSDK